jgi:putative FmdB family regulatory protein
MPIYEYECAKCGSFEVSQSIHDVPLSRCPKCRRRVQRLISATSFRLKGGGWYNDGYQKGASKKSDGDSTTAKTETTETKAAPATAEAAPKKKKSKAAGSAKAAASSS